MPDGAIRGAGPWRVLLVEDEPGLVLTLTDRLQAEGYAVEAVETGERALELALDGGTSPRFDLVILDVMLPGKGGFDVCRDLRAAGFQAPVLMLTARDAVTDRVVGLKLGADDYLTKPFDMLELLARIEALLRRPAVTTPGGSGTYRFGDVLVDFDRGEVTRQGQPVELSAMEYRLLRHFVEQRGRLLSRSELLEQVWEQDASVYTRTVDVHVRWLRQKLEPNPSHPRYIVTVHRRGYKFVGG